ncbi:hypothetical protein Tco_0212923 [Tanacetum coccineum]
MCCGNRRFSEEVWDGMYVMRRVLVSVGKVVEILRVHGERTQGVVVTSEEAVGRIVKFYYTIRDHDYSLGLAGLLPTFLRKLFLDC